MATQKKKAELVFNVKWRTKSDYSIIGMYDTPSTTSSFEMFKSYLLKNSGVPGNDVKVTYLTDNGHEWLLDSQECFEIALSSFRLLARLGEVIFLKLDRISHTRKISNDVETQSDVESMGVHGDAPPEWFISYMKQFHKDIVEEITLTVSSNVIENNKERERGAAVPVFTRKCVGKPETKKLRKHESAGECSKDWAMWKALKYEKKLETKLDKLDAKTKKIKEKKQALISRIETDDKYVEEERPLLEKEKRESSPNLNAAILNPQNNDTYERMIGGEVYLHRWTVVNNGNVTWPQNTEFRQSWGSADMIPSSKSIVSPILKPGEQGHISVRFKIPQKPGTYETYWNFYCGETRFGHTLSFCVIVEEPLTSIFSARETPQNTKESSSERQSPDASQRPRGKIPKSEVLLFPERVIKEEPVAVLRKFRSSPDQENLEFPPPPSWNNVMYYVNNMDEEKAEKRESSGIEELQKFKDLSIEDPEWMKFFTIRKSNSYGITESEVVVDVPSEIKEKVEDDNNNVDNSNSENLSVISDISSGYDVLQVPVGDEKLDISDYVYITIDGNKLSVPKHILNPEYLATAESAPMPSIIATEQAPNQLLEASTTAPQPELLESKYEHSRLFIFPQRQPGYEVITSPPPQHPSSLYPDVEIRSDQSEVQVPTVNNEAPITEAQMPHVPNFQQTPRMEASAPPTSPTSTPPLCPAEGAVPAAPQTYLQESLVSGAVNVASSAINTARSVINMIAAPRGEPGRWVGGHWITEDSRSTRAKNLVILAEMGFWDTDLNATLLARFNDDVARVVNELCHQ